jgi:DNA-binding phage protein
LGALRDVPRKTPITLTGEITEILASGKVGSLALILDDKDVVLLLRAAVEREGSISALAKRHGIERTNLSNVLNRKRPVSSSLVKVLGLQCVHSQKRPSAVIVGRCLLLLDFVV